MLSKELYPNPNSKRGAVFYEVLRLHRSHTPEQICREVLRIYPQHFSSLREIVGPHYEWQRRANWYPDGTAAHPPLARQGYPYREAPAQEPPRAPKPLQERLAEARRALEALEREEREREAALEDEMSAAEELMTELEQREAA